MVQPPSPPESPRPRRSRGAKPPPPPPSKLARTAASLRAGFTQPSPIALGITILVAGSLWVATMFGVGPELLARYGDYLAAHGHDTYAYVTTRLQEIAQDPHPADLQVYFTGASGLIYGISRMEHVEEGMTEALHTPVHAWSLLNADQSILECLSLVENLPSRFDGAVVIGVNPYRLSRGLAGRQQDGPYDYRLGFRSRYEERSDRELGVPLPPRISYFWDNRSYFLPRVKFLFHNLRMGPPREFETNPAEAGGRHAPPKRWADHRDQMAPIAAGRFREQSPISLKAIASVATEVLRRGRVKVVLLEAPMAPRARKGVYGEEFMQGYQRHLEAFAAEHGFEYWDLTAEAELTDEDFYDWTHLNRAEARRRYSQVLASRLAALLADEAARR